LSRKKKKSKVINMKIILINSINRVLLVYSLNLLLFRLTFYKLNSLTILAY
jgi:hypothetical protein